MSKITLSGKLGGIVLVDDEDYDRVTEYSWYQTSHGYVARKPSSGIIYLHWFISGYNGREGVDHINRDKLDNRRSNLRHISRGQNLRNRALRKDNNTGYKGVHITKTGRFEVRFTVNKKQVYLGSFTDKLHAIKIAQEFYKELPC